MAKPKSEIWDKFVTWWKFLRRAIAQIEGEIKIRIPAIPELEVAHPNIAQLAKNKNLVQTLEQLCSEWEQRISQILKQELPTVRNHIKMHYQSQKNTKIK